MFSSAIFIRQPVNSCFIVKTPKIFVKNNLDLKVKELLTKKIKYITPGKDISMLQLKAVKDDDKFFITYKVGKPKPGIETGSEIILVQPEIAESDNLKKLINLTDDLRDYYEPYRGMVIGYYYRKKSRGGLAKIFLKNHLSSEKIIETVKDFYPNILEEVKILKIKYR